MGESDRQANEMFESLTEAELILLILFQVRKDVSGEMSSWRFKRPDRPAVL
jgi:hypothetical protein